MKRKKASKPAQCLVFVKEWIDKGLGHELLLAAPISLEWGKPDRVWTLYQHKDESKPPALPFKPIHKDGAFLEDQMHDWNMREGKFVYRSRVSNGPVWLLLEYES